MVCELGLFVAELVHYWVQQGKGGINGEELMVFIANWIIARRSHEED